MAFARPAVGQSPEQPYRSNVTMRILGIALHHYVSILWLGSTLLGAAVPHRIVSTAPSITETLFAMGLGRSIVGVTNYCTYPSEVTKLPKVGTYLKPDVEVIAALHPDLVVVQKQSNRLGEQLGLLHIRYIEVESDNLEAIYRGATAIGKVTDHAAAATQLVSTIKSGLQQVADSAASFHKTPTAAFIVGHTPGRLEDLIAGAGGSYFSDLLTTAGAANIFAEARAPYPNISLEEILSRNPDYILEMSGDSRPSQAEVLALWSARKSLHAVTNHHVFAVPAAPFLVPGPRAPQAARLLLHLLHPELP